MWTGSGTVEARIREGDSSLAVSMELLEKAYLRPLGVFGTTELPEWGWLAQKPLAGWGRLRGCCEPRSVATGLGRGLFKV